MSNPNELLERYAIELDTDTQVDITNIMEKQLSAPNVKHKWLYKLTQAKQQMLKLMYARDEIRQTIIDSNNLPISDVVLKRKSSNDPRIIALEKDIAQYQILVDYLDVAVKQINQIGFDFKNIVELMKMENL